jgi:hypothetical protein
MQHHNSDAAHAGLTRPALVAYGGEGAKPEPAKPKPAEQPKDGAQPDKKS